MARLPIETGSNTARNLSYFLFNLGDTRDKGLNALTNGLSGLGNTISDYYKTQRAFDEAAKERQRAENLQIQKMQQDEAYRQADLNLKKENLEFEKYKYNNPKPREMSVEDRLLLNAMDNFNNYNPNAVSNVSLEPNLQMPQQMPQQQSNVETIKPSNLRNAQLSQFFKDNSQEIQSIPQATNAKAQSPLINTAAVQDSARLNTGIAYFDNKEKLSFGDYLLAKRMGVDLGKARGDLNIKKQDVGKSIEKANDNLVALKSTSNLILDTKEQAGVINGLVRGLHNFTGGLTPLNGELARYNSRDLANVKNLAQSDAAGKATNQDKKDAKEIYGTKLRNPQEQRDTLSGALESTLYNLEGNIRNIQNKGGELPKGMYEMYLMYKDFDAYLRQSQKTGNFSWSRARNMIKYIENSDYGKKFDYNEWAKIRGNVK